MECEVKPPALKRGTQCLNCGLLIDSAYCPDCGQHNTSHNHGLWQFLQEFLEEFIRFDSKLIRTIIPLVTKPGFLTQEWTAGKRVRYITPLKLYVTLSAICFLVISMRAQFYGSKPGSLNINVGQPKIATSSVSKSDSALDSLFTRKFGHIKSPEDMSLVSQKFISQLPTANFVIMPIVAAIFWLLYIRNKRYYVEHLVFTLHYYSFAFLVVTITSLIPFRIFGLFGMVWIFIYLPMALVRNYGQGYLKTIVKLIIFGGIYAIVLAAALFGALVLTALQVPDKPTVEASNVLAKNAPAK